MAGIDSGKPKGLEIFKLSNLIPLLIRTAGIAAGAVLIGVLFNLVINPRSIPFFAAQTYDIYGVCSLAEGGGGIEKISLEDMAQSQVGGMVIIDSRSSLSFQQGHIPGAVSLPHDPLVCPDESLVDDLVRKGQTVVVYGKGDPEEDTCMLLAEELHREGVEKVLCLEGGFAAWAEAEMPVERN